MEGLGPRSDLLQMSWLTQYDRDLLKSFTDSCSQMPSLTNLSFCALNSK